MKKTKKSTVIVLLSVVYLIISVLLCYYQIKYDEICDSLNCIVYDMVEETYINYGNIKYSKYKDIISPLDYLCMYYGREGGPLDDGTDPDRSKNGVDVYEANHSIPETVLINSYTAETKYTYSYMYACKDESRKEPREYRDGFIYYGLYGEHGAISECTIRWQLQSDGKWHIVDFREKV